MQIAALIGIMMAIVIGVNLIPFGEGIAAVLPLIFATVIILGAVAWIELSDSHAEDTALPPAVSGATVRSRQWLREQEHWRLVAIASVILLAWAVITLLGWNS